MGLKTLGPSALLRDEAFKCIYIDSYTVKINRWLYRTHQVLVLTNFRFGMQTHDYSSCKNIDPADLNDYIQIPDWQAKHIGRLIKAVESNIAYK